MPQWYSFDTVFPALPSTHATPIDFVCTMLLLTMVFVSLLMSITTMMNNAENGLSRATRCKNTKKAGKWLLGTCACIALGNYAPILGAAILGAILVRDLFRGIVNSVGACDTSTH